MRGTEEEAGDQGTGHEDHPHVNEAQAPHLHGPFSTTSFPFFLSALLGIAPRASCMLVKA